jgi:hypothetical protein
LEPEIEKAKKEGEQVNRKGQREIGGKGIEGRKRERIMERN